MGSIVYANIYLTNTSDYAGVIKLYHKSRLDEGSSIGGYVEAGGTIGPLRVEYGIGTSYYGFMDYWAARLTTYQGDTRKLYGNDGGGGSDTWKECMLESSDQGKDFYFTIDKDDFKINIDSGGETDDVDKIRENFKMTNIFVLMLENRSFDNVFALSNIPNITKATTSDFNNYNGQNYYVQGQAPMEMSTDPGHEFLDVVEQLCGQGATFESGEEYPNTNNAGFASNYATTDSEGDTPVAADIGDIMKCFDTGTQLPIIRSLATNFALMDHWYSSLPGPTWPNRFFVHGATSSGLDHSPSMTEMVEWSTVHGFRYDNGSVFDALKDEDMPYKLYIDYYNNYTDKSGNGSITSGSLPQVSSIKGIDIPDVKHLHHFEDNLNQEPYDYAYTFIEPNYGDIVDGSYSGGSSQHPMDDTYGGENLIKDVYEKIRNSPNWYDSMLVVVYDEHGGFYDSQPPVPMAVPGDIDTDLNEYGFGFDISGVRVPAVVVSPWIPQGVVNSNACDHAVIPNTIGKVCNFPHLTERDQDAYNLYHLLTLSSPRMDCPTHLENPVSANSKQVVQGQAITPAQFSAQPLPKRGNLIGALGIILKDQIASANGDDAKIQEYIKDFKALKTNGDAQAYVQKNLPTVTTRMEALHNKEKEKQKLSEK